MLKEKMNTMTKIYNNLKNNYQNLENNYQQLLKKNVDNSANNIIYHNKK